MNFDKLVLIRYSKLLINYCNFCAYLANKEEDRKKKEAEELKKCTEELEQKKVKREKNKTYLFSARPLFSAMMFLLPHPNSLRGPA